MTGLTKHELQFLSSQGLGASDVYDTKGRAPLRVRDEAKRLGKTVLLGKPCNKGGHRLRTRAGHCVQCDTSKLSHEGRYSQTGEVYVLVSMAKGLTKVGFSTDTSTRARKTQWESYGGASDWRLVFTIETQDAGRLEHLAQKTLARYCTRIDYVKDGHVQVSKETYKCRPIVAVNAIIDAAAAGGFTLISDWRDSSFKW